MLIFFIIFCVNPFLYKSVGFVILLPHTVLEMFLSLVRSCSIGQVHITVSVAECGISIHICFVIS